MAKINKKKIQKSGIEILIIGSVIALVVILCLYVLFKFDNWPVEAILETIVGVIVAYTIFLYSLFIKYLILPFQVKIFTFLENRWMNKWGRNNKKKVLIFASIAVFLRVIPIIIILMWVTLDFASAGVNQTLIYEVLGGITGAWALGIFFRNFGINPE